MNFEPFPVDGNEERLGQIIQDTNQSKRKIKIRLIEYAELIFNGSFTVGEKGILKEEVGDNGEKSYTVDVYGKELVITIIDAEPPSDDRRFIKVFAPNSLS